MTPDEIAAALAARTAPANATPEQRAALHREALRAVRAAGSRAVPAWALVRDLPDAELVAAFAAQAEALKPPPPTEAQKEALRNWARRRKSYSPYLKR
ncbi:hypothetical protein [Rhodospirillum centenum]|uniref:Uncharacterized protein n=1 Tax=Rhodospirillum centenum (strain ATCC 51521 / SW) TaxID=414684 RepID=B6IMM7_RHOCS|nr:hypothetical protein [Rhodospirillum centenum]ACI98693.1 phage-related hypothetical protein [Rhodospirillum centenum SW]